jgi:hypothetical protein
MRSRILIYVGVLAILAQVTAAQSIAPGVPDTIKKTAASKKWRTPWGDPDLQGSWSNATTTPLQRPAKYAGREFLTAEERAAQDSKPPSAGTSALHPARRKTSPAPTMRSGGKWDRRMDEHRSSTIRRTVAYLP